MFMLTSSSPYYLPSNVSSSLTNDFDFWSAIYDRPNYKLSRLFPSDLRERDDQYILTLNLPGAKKDNIKVKFSETDKTLHISYEYVSQNESDDSKYIWRERKAGSYSRNFQFPSDIDADSIEAEFIDGVLTITLNKIEKLISTDKDIIVK